MKVEIDDRPVSDKHPKGTCAIRLMPETNKEMAQLERCLTVNVQFEKFRRWAHSDMVWYGFYGYYAVSAASNPDTSESKNCSTINQKHD